MNILKFQNKKTTVHNSFYHSIREKAELDCDSQEDAEQLVRVINELTDQS